MSQGLGGWKTRITSTMRTNSRMNALLNDSLNLMTLGKKKNLNKLKEAMQETSPSVMSTESKEELNETEPRPNIEEVRRVLKDTVNEQLHEEKFFQTYNSQISAKFCQILARELRNRLKQLQHDR